MTPKSWPSKDVSRLVLLLFFFSCASLESRCRLLAVKAISIEPCQSLAGNSLGAGRDSSPTAGMSWNFDGLLLELLAMPGISQL